MDQEPIPKRLDSQIGFILELEKLKTVKRQNLTLDGHRPENSAEHSWHVAMMAPILVEYARIKPKNLDRVIRMLLVHDLGELGAGDTWLYDETARAGAAQREEEALEELCKRLPKEQGREILELWREFEYGETAEARYARVLDALQPLIGHLHFAPIDHNFPQLSAEKVLAKKAFIQEDAPDLWPLVEDTVRKSAERGLYGK